MSEVSYDELKVSFTSVICCIAFDAVDVPDVAILKFVSNVPL